MLGIDAEATEGTVWPQYHSLESMRAQKWATQQYTTTATREKERKREKITSKRIKDSDCKN